MVANNGEVEKRLWRAADELRANSRLKSSEYSVPVLGLLFRNRSGSENGNHAAACDSISRAGRRDGAASPRRAAA
jgi:hypothetical protein